MPETILLIGPDGINLGQHDLETAEQIAEEQFGLDLVEVREGVFKILDLGKLQYEASKRKQQKPKQLKEMKFKLSIGEADLQTKVSHIQRFLKNLHPVRVTIWFNGREVSRPEVGISLMQIICSKVLEFGDCSMNTELQGKNMTMNIEPKKK